MCSRAQFTLFDQLGYAAGIMATKTALCLFLLRVAKNRSHIWILRILMWANIAAGTPFCFIILFQCWPIHMYWDLDPGKLSVVAKLCLKHEGSQSTRRRRISGRYGNQY
jgi:hypothetical protein